MPAYHAASGSTAEDLFIDLFSDTFGAEKAGYLYSQYPFYDIYQNSRFADFVLENGPRRPEAVPRAHPRARGAGCRGLRGPVAGDHRRAIYGLRQGAGCARRVRQYSKRCAESGQVPGLRSSERRLRLP